MLMTEPAISAAIDYDELRTGKRREATYNGILTLVARLSIVFTGITLIIVKWVTGFDSSNTVHTDLALDGLRSLITIVPVITIVLSAMIFATFPINLKKFGEMQHTLKQLHKERLDRLGE